MNLEELLGSVESEEVKEAIVELINAEKDRGIEASRKKDRENLELKADLKDLGWDKEKYATKAEFKESLKNTSNEVKESKLTIATLNDKINELVTNLDSEREATRKSQQKAKESKLNAELTSAIGNDFYGADYLIKDLIREGRVDINDNTIVFKDGETTIPFDKGIEQLKEQNKRMLRSNQQGGSGDVGGETPDVDADLMAKGNNEILDALGL